RLGAEGDQVRIHRADEDTIAQHGYAAVHLPAANIDLAGQAAPIAPELAAGGRVEGDYVRRRLAEIHHAIDHQRRGFDAVGDRHLVYPAQLEILHVLAIDLIELAVPPAFVGAGIGEPV